MRRALRPALAAAALLLGAAAAWAQASRQPAALPASAASAAAAVPGVDAPPPAGPPRPVQLPALEQRTLANGLGLVVAPRHELPLVSLTLLLRGGPELDPPGRSGTAALTAGLLAKGARRGGRAVDATALARQAEALGSTLDSASSWRASTLSMTVTRPKLDAAVALLADVARRPLLADDELARLRAQTLDGLRVSFSDPAALAGMALRRSFWGDSPYGRVATPASLRRITRADLQRFHAEVYRPELATLVLVGDIEPAQAQALAQRLFGDWPLPRRPPLRAPLAPAAPTLAEPLLLIDLPGSGQSVVALAAPFVASDAPERRPAQLASAVLGGGYSARLNQQVRVRRGLSYGAFSDAESQPPGGMLVAQAQTRHDAAAQVLQLMRDEIAGIATTPPTADELAARQATLVGGFARRLQSTGGLSALIVGQLAQGRPLADLARRVDEILAVTPDQVSAYAARTWRPATLRGVIAGDLQAAGAGLPTEGARRLTLQQLDLDRADLQRPPR